VREVSLVMHRSFVKRQLINVLQAEILANLPAELVSSTGAVVGL